MATLPIHNLQHEEIGTIELSETVFGAEVNEHLFYEVIKWQMARRRAGTASTKGRNEVTGGGAKPHRQKGTGRARQGSRRAPNHVGGGVVHGPRPRSYDYHMNKKVRQGALRSALSLRLSQGKIVVIDTLSFEAPKTRVAAGVFGQLAEGSALVVDGPNENLQLSVRNLPKVKYLNVDGFNLYDVLNHEYLVLSEPIVRRLEGALAK
jgi:large subunit ribosomal protein L4